MPPSDPVPTPEGGFKERHFLEVLRKSGEVPEDRLESALKFQQKALERKGKKIRIERVLVRLGLLDEPRLEALYEQLRYGIARKEDKWYCKIAVKSRFCSEEETRDALAEFCRQCFA